MVSNRSPAVGRGDRALPQRRPGTASETCNPDRKQDAADRCEQQRAATTRPDPALDRGHRPSRLGWRCQVGEKWDFHKRERHNVEHQ